MCFLLHSGTTGSGTSHPQNGLSFGRGQSGWSLWNCWLVGPPLISCPAAGNLLKSPGASGRKMGQRTSRVPSDLTSPRHPSTILIGKSPQAGGKTPSASHVSPGAQRARSPPSSGLYGMKVPELFFTGARPMRSTKRSGCFSAYAKVPAAEPFHLIESGLEYLPVPHSYQRCTLW